MQIEKIGVVGAGTMGSSITVALISKGYPVLLKDVNEKAVQSGLSKIDKLIESRIEKRLPIADAKTMRALVQPVNDYSAFSEMDLVIEATIEDLESKKKVFEDLDKNCNANAILATNTSSLPVTRLAAFTRRPDKVVGMHFFNPAHLMKLIEVIAGLDTSPSTVKTIMDFAAKLDKLPVRVEECASFLVNRLLGRYMNEALWCLEEGIATVEELDRAAMDYVMPIGPLALRDMNGADIGLAVANFNYQEYGERFRPANILPIMVEKNLLGKKTGAGFYIYDPENKKRQGANPELRKILQQIGASQDQPKEEFQVERLFLPMINEAFLALQEKVCDAEDLDPALMAGLGMRKGPLTLAAEIGLANCLNQIENLYAKFGERFRPAPLLKRYVWANRTNVV